LKWRKFVAQEGKEYQRKLGGKPREMIGYNGFKEDMAMDRADLKSRIHVSQPYLMGLKGL